MKKALVWILILLSAVAILLRFSDKLAQVFLGVKPTSGISVLSEPKDAVVYLDSKEVGKTPYENKDLEARDYLIKIEKEGASWQGKVTLSAGTVTVINRDLASDLTSSAGEILTLNKGQGLTIVSNPTEAEIEIDGKSVGKTPLTLDIQAGEHTVLISHSNYLKRSIRATLPANFNLTMAVDLALSEADLTAITAPAASTTPQVNQVIVNQTPTGFLRVRDKPNLAGVEIARVQPGEKLTLLEEQNSWDKVRLTDGKEGYVSSSYVTKQP